MFVNSLSGRFLILSIIFVMLAEVLIFVPSVARFREEYLIAKLEKSQIASLSVLASERGGVGPELAAGALWYRHTDGAPPAEWRGQPLAAVLPAPLGKSLALYRPAP
mgnify:CR=1 FL=1